MESQRQQPDEGQVEDPPRGEPVNADADRFDEDAGGTFSSESLEQSEERNQPED